MKSINVINKGDDFMSLLQIRRNFQITLPSQLRRALGIKEGDIVEAELLDNEAIIIKPKTLVGKGRNFSKSEIEAWMKEDELDMETSRKAKKLLGVK